MKYFHDLEVQLDEIVVLGVAELCQCPAMGEFTKEGFMNGWKLVRYVPSFPRSPTSAFFLQSSNHHTI
jgi:hypothetical protein